MLDKLTDNIVMERNKIIDDCTLKLLTLAGCDLPPNYTNFELLMVMDELKRKQYTISIESNYNGTINEAVVLKQYGIFKAGYEIIVQYKLSKVTVTTKLL